MICRVLFLSEFSFGSYGAPWNVSVVKVLKTLLQLRTLFTGVQPNCLEAMVTRGNTTYYFSTICQSISNFVRTMVNTDDYLSWQFEVWHFTILTWDRNQWENPNICNKERKRRTFWTCGLMCGTYHSRIFEFSWVILALLNISLAKISKCYSSHSFQPISTTRHDKYGSIAEISLLPCLAIC